MSACDVVGVLWVWDHAEPLTRGFAEWAERNVLPFGWSIIRDERPLRAPSVQEQR